MKEIDLQKLHEICGDRAAGLEMEMYEFLFLLDHNFDLKVFLEDPGIAAERKRELLQGLLDDRSSLFRQLLFLLIDEGMIRNFRSLADEFTALISGRTGTQSVKVMSAGALTGEEKEKIGKKLGRSRVRYEIDPSLIGGLSIKWESGQLMDASFAGCLNELKEKISA